MGHLDNIWARIDKVAEVLNLNSWLVETLKSFKSDPWASHIEVKMDQGDPKYFRAIVSQHRSPHKGQPTKGGLRLHPNVNEDVLKAHAVEMSVKCWIMGIEWGGAKSGVVVDPTKLSERELKNLIESLVLAMWERNLLGSHRYVPAPDIYTNEKIMNWIRQAYTSYQSTRENDHFFGVVTGKPVGYGYGGIPGRIEATGYGVLVVLNQFINMANDKTLVIQGFGNVGSNTAQFAPSFGLKVTAVSDVNGGIYNPKGLSISEVSEYYQANRTLLGFTSADHVSNEELLELPCDILVPAALEHVITKDNASKIKAHTILEAANGPTTPEADEILKDRNILVIPDVLANAGGVTVSFFEWAHNVNLRDERIPQAHKREVLKAMSAMLEISAQEVQNKAQKYNVSLREGAYILAIERTAPLFRSKHLP